MNDKIIGRSIDFVAAEDALYRLSGVKGVLDNLAAVPERGEYATDPAMFLMLSSVISDAVGTLEAVTLPKLEASN